MERIRNDFNIFRNRLEDNKISIEQLYEQKLDTKVHIKDKTNLDSQIIAMNKRLEHEAGQVKHFGNFFLRYMPVMFQIAVSENLNNCLDVESLTKFHVYQEGKIQEYKQTCTQRFNKLDYVAYL